MLHRYVAACKADHGVPKPEERAQECKDYMNEGMLVKLNNLPWAFMVRAL